MFVSKALGINEKNHLTIGGVDTVELAKEYGTPLYVMDEQLIRDNCRMYKHSIDKYYNSEGLVLYASKAFCCKEIYKIIMDEGLGIDVVSGGELYTAMQVNFPAEKIYFHGNNKTKDELNLALDYKVGVIIVDNLYELNELNELAALKNTKQKIMFRIKPGIDAHTHDFVMTGQIDSKFGFALETGEAFEAVKLAADMPNLELIGLHCHIGSQIFDIAPFELAAEVMISFYAKIKNELGIELTSLNLGGGFGIKYIPTHNPVEYDSYMGKVAQVVKSTSEKNNVKPPFVLIEPGRSIAGPAGITLYKVGAIKTIPNIRTYITVDGGMTDNPRYALYGSPYDAVIANRAADEKTEIVTIAGKCCESGDLIQEGISVQKADKGDILAVLATGAYNYSMSSNYNRIPRPPVVMIKDKQPKLIVKRETYEDLIRNDL